MKCSQEGLALIKKFEGCRLKAYRCSANVLTIGYGHTGGVKEDDNISQPEADELLKEDIAKFINCWHYTDPHIACAGAQKSFVTFKNRDHLETRNRKRSTVVEDDCTATTSGSVKKGDPSNGKKTAG